VGWTADYFELTELHVRPDAQGAGLGEGLLRALLAGTDRTRVLLSTPEHGHRPPGRAWRLYRRLGFRDVLREHLFTGDARPFAVLGRTLPLPPPGPATGHGPSTPRT
jgi:ribosomal protein S18 acetylase RimI-like enzyme